MSRVHRLLPSTSTIALQRGGRDIDGRRMGLADAPDVVGGEGMEVVKGITNGTVAGIVLRDAITGQDKRLADIYDPVRRDITRGVGTFMRENLKVARTGSVTV